ncbi:DNA-methyltransferase [Heliophilum fasciatum]|uniref:Methyltransferase n=1 Tax=Heliophilum fasciatum TaxID=35700 RepID=A0A4R2RFX6_9FIRM|nr:site-specific DNA-methyltransferase [Heliophilum fasciatum]MCW2278708.1 site-specific DNA-methyltransferase (adenine-specific) [Heliophilum fasciatum]TCP62552.1 site-specific DNA-methyltransferase (adenine-specific) [Heliophilum fasciatum]
MTNLPLNTVLTGDSLDVLKTMPDNSIDACVTDPPYGLSKEPNIREVLTKWMTGEDYAHRAKGFMGKTWDSFVPGPAIWTEVFRVLKPGGHILCFSGTRTQDLMTIALRMGGFEIRDVIEWLYVSGFPKSMDISKAFDKKAGVERHIIGQREVVDIRNGHGREYGSAMFAGEKTGKIVHFISEPTTELAKQWDGWGSSIKPAHEPVIMARKPLIGTICDTVEQYGTGAINIRDCRIPFANDNERKKLRHSPVENQGNSWKNSSEVIGYMTPDGLPPVEGRFPANCVTTDADQWFSPYFNITPQELSKKSSKKDRNSDWQGNVINLEERRTYPGSGRGVINSPYTMDGKERKPVKSRNHHPTVKPVDLMAWLIKLVTPPGGTVLDPFGGSGSTAVAARKHGFNYILIEREEEYAEVARARAS